MPVCHRKSRKRLRQLALTPAPLGGDVGPDKSDAYCLVCFDGGDLLVCSGCTRVCHRKCLPSPPSEADLEDCDWFCPVCEAESCLVCGAGRGAGLVTCDWCQGSLHPSCIPPLWEGPLHLACPNCTERVSARLAAFRPPPAAHTVPCTSLPLAQPDLALFDTIRLPAADAAAAVPATAAGPDHAAVTGQGSEGPTTSHATASHPTAPMDPHPGPRPPLPMSLMTRARIVSILMSEDVALPPGDQVALFSRFLE